MESRPSNALSRAKRTSKGAYHEAIIYTGLLNLDLEICHAKQQRNFLCSIAERLSLR